jgi:hypothetical protein
MPPQQAYGLLDFVDNVLDFAAHDPASCEPRYEVSVK